MLTRFYEFLAWACVALVVMVAARGCQQVVRGAPAPLPKRPARVADAPFPLGTWRVRVSGLREVTMAFSPDGAFRECDDCVVWRGTWRYDGVLFVRSRTNDAYEYCEWRVTFPYLDPKVGEASGDCMTGTTLEFLERVRR